MNFLKVTEFDTEKNVYINFEHVQEIKLMLAGVESQWKTAVLFPDYTVYVKETPEEILSKI